MPNLERRGKCVVCPLETYYWNLYVDVSVARTNFPRIARQWQDDKRESAHEGSSGTTKAGSHTRCQDSRTARWPADVGSADLYQGAADSALSVAF